VRTVRGSPLLGTFRTTFRTVDAECPLR